MYFIARVKKGEVLDTLFTAKLTSALLFNFDVEQAGVTGTFELTKSLNKKYTLYKHQTFLGGMHNEPLISQYASNAHILCAVMTPVGVHHLIKESTTTMLNEGFPFDILGLEKQFDGLTEKLRTIKKDDEAQILVESHLLRYFNRLDIPFSVKDMSPVANYILQQKGVVKINKLETKFHLSRRWLEKQFAEQMGVSPKEFVRITRFNALLAQVMTTPSVSWSEMIEQFGYYDHSHLIRDFHDFTGQSPTQYYKDYPSIINNFFYELGE